ncbi:MAG: permease [Bacillota bacterium]
MKNLKHILLPLLFLLVAVVGLYYVKWNPYYHKAFVAAIKNSIGDSIISGKSMSGPQPSWAAAWGYTVSYFNAIWKAMFLGLLLGSLVQVLLPVQWIKKTLGGTGFGSTAVAGAAALPGMMCSCCAAPIAVGLRERSASINAALAFFLANPVLNPATIIFMGFVLSWKFALYRVVFGIILVVGISTLASRLIKEEEGVDYPVLSQESFADNGSIFVRWMHALWQLIIDTLPAYFIVVTLLGAFRAWLFPVIDPAWANSILTIIGLAITGTLFVIPTAAEIPIVQTLMTFGLGVGPAAALLITLPAVSLPSLLIIRRAFPARVLIFVAVAVALVGITAGLLALVVL